MQGKIEVISSAEKGAWVEALDGVVAYDFYHLPFYHDLAKERGEGEPHLFVYKNEEYSIILPLLVRQIPSIPSHFSRGQQWCDATSTYGYVGPVASHKIVAPQIVQDFQASLKKVLLQMGVVSAFSRLHPFLDQTALLSSLGQLVFQGHTVSIDLTTPEEAQRAEYRENHQRNIRKLLSNGAICIVDEDLRYLDTFIDDYCASMARVNAREEYNFPHAYFRELVSTQEAEVKLVVCLLDGEVISSGLFVKCQGILEYHLGATPPIGRQLGAMKLVLDEARRWGHHHGARLFHLGGGVGSRDDSLFMFKSGFSRRLHPFNTWQWIARPEVYDAIVNDRKRKFLSPGSRVHPFFFPAYRAPEIAVTSLGESQCPREGLSHVCSMYQHDTVPLSDPADISVESGVAVRTGRSTASAGPSEKQRNIIQIVERKRVLILGAGGHARVIADAILRRSAKRESFELIGFLDDDPSLLNKEMLGRPVVGSLADLSSIPCEAVVIGVGDNETRCQIFHELTNRGIHFASVIHPEAILAHDVKIGKGTVIFAGAIVNTGAVIGDNAILNTGCSVDHDCTVESHTHICPGARLGGTVKIGEGAFVGINSTIIHNRKIGEWCTVGGGAVVIRDVAPCTTVVGVPARPLLQKETRRKPDTRDIVQHMPKRS